MAKLKDYVELIENNKDCAILKVKDGSRLGLISLGYFNGNEDLIRLTKGKQRTCTVFYTDGTNFSWYWGNGSTLLVSDAVQKKGRLIEECLMMDFDINMVDKIEDTLYIKDYKSSEGKKQTFKLCYSHLNSDTTLHRDDVYLTTFKNYEEARNYVYKILDDIDEEGVGTINSHLITISGIRKKVS